MKTEKIIAATQDPTCHLGRSPACDFAYAGSRYGALLYQGVVLRS